MTDAGPRYRFELRVLAPNSGRVYYRDVEPMDEGGDPALVFAALEFRLNGLLTAVGMESLTRMDDERRAR